MKVEGTGMVGGKRDVRVVVSCRSSGVLEYVNNDLCMLISMYDMALMTLMIIF